MLIPYFLAVAYIIIIVRFFRPGGLRKLLFACRLGSLQGSPWLLLAGWLHYLAFNLFAGTWEVRHPAIVPSLLLTFMLGPAGLLLFVVTRFGFRRRLSARQ
jgi:thiosulfate reductase cytochrome b subunit